MDSAKGRKLHDQTKYQGKVEQQAEYRACDFKRQCTQEQLTTDEGKCAFAEFVQCIEGCIQNLDNKKGQ